VQERDRRERESVISVEFYYTAETTWREVHNDKAQFSVLINGWETWEPKDKSNKDALRTHWTKDEEEDKKMNSKKNGPQGKDWWEQEDKGYNTDRNLKVEYDWEDKTNRMIKKRLGVVEEDTDDVCVLTWSPGGEGRLPNVRTIESPSSGPPPPDT